MLTYDQVLDHVLSIVHLEPARRDPDVSLYADWDIDSLQAYVIVTAIEDLAAIDDPPDFVPELFTPRDVYAYYQSLLRPSGSGRT